MKVDRRRSVISVNEADKSFPALDDLERGPWNSSVVANETCFAKIWIYLGLKWLDGNFVEINWNACSTICVGTDINSISTFSHPSFINGPLEK